MRGRIMKEGIGNIDYDIEMRCIRIKRGIEDMDKCAMLVVLVL